MFQKYNIEMANQLEFTRKSNNYYSTLHFYYTYKFLPRLQILIYYIITLLHLKIEIYKYKK